MTGKHAPAVDRFWRHVRITDGCWLWTAYVNSQGYGQFGESSKKIVGAHRFSWRLHFSAIPEGLDVLHRCDVPGCVKPDHLWLGTDDDNSKDKVAKGRQYKPNHIGEKNNSSKITEADVREIRKLYKGRGNGITQASLAVKYGISRSQVAAIVLRTKWIHVL